MTGLRTVALAGKAAPEMSDFSLRRYVPAIIGVFEATYTQASVVILRREFHLTLAEARVLLVVGTEPGISGLRVSKAFGIDPSLVSRSLRKLTERGLTQSAHDPSHARRQILTLTVDGAAMYDRLVRFSLEREAVLLQTFSPLERGLLIDLLRKLLDAVPDANAFAQTRRDRQ